eukprot:Opistho-2@57636
MPFSLRNFEDEKQARLGVTECLKHNVVEAFNVLYEKDDELVAQFKFTALITANGTIRINGLPVDAALYKTEHAIQTRLSRRFWLRRRTARPRSPRSRKTTPPLPMPLRPRPPQPPLLEEPLNLTGSERVCTMCLTRTRMTVWVIGRVLGMPLGGLCALCTVCVYASADNISCVITLCQK